jgi:hypothetical protein
MRGVSAVRPVAVLIGCMVLAAAIVQPAAAGNRLAVEQLQFPLPLLVRGDTVEMGYDARRTPSATGFLYVRNDLQHAFTRVPLKLRKAKEQLVPRTVSGCFERWCPAGCCAGTSSSTTP